MRGEMIILELQYNAKYTVPVSLRIGVKVAEYNVRVPVTTFSPKERVAIFNFSGSISAVTVSGTRLLSCKYRTLWCNALDLDPDPECFAGTGSNQWFVLRNAIKSVDQNYKIQTQFMFFLNYICYGF